MSLVLHYKLNESSSASLGTDSVGSLDATNTGVTAFSDPTYGQVAYFDGSADLTLPAVSVPTALTGSSARTVSLWIRTLSFTDEVITSVGNQSSAGARWRVQIKSPAQVSVAYYQVAGTQTTTAIGSGWRHFAIVYDGSNSKVYMDGVAEFDETRSINTFNTDLGIGIDTTGAVSTQFNGYMIDYRVYDGDLGQSDITTLFGDGPELGFTFQATMYSHLADLTWSSVSGASSYTVTQSEDSGPISTILDASTDLAVTSPTLAGSSYTYNLYSDLDLVTPLATLSEIADTVTTVTVQSLLTRISNDLTIITETAIDDIDSVLRDVLSTGDVIEYQDGSATFVADSDTLALPSNGDSAVLTPFDVSAGSGQTATVTLPDASNEVLTYDESTDEVVYSATNYAIGEHFKVGSFKVTVKEL